MPWLISPTPKDLGWRLNGAIPASPPQMVEYGRRACERVMNWVSRASGLIGTVLVNLDLSQRLSRVAVAALYLESPPTGSCFPAGKNASGHRVRRGSSLQRNGRLPRGLRLEADVTYLDSIYYPDYLNAPGIRCRSKRLLFGSVSGQATNFAPRWSGNISANYSMKIAGVTDSPPN